MRADLGISTHQLWSSVAAYRRATCGTVAGQIADLELSLVKFASDWLPIAEPGERTRERDWVSSLVISGSLSICRSRDLRSRVLSWRIESRRQCCGDLEILFGPMGARP